MHAAAGRACVITSTSDLRLGELKKTQYQRLKLTEKMQHYISGSPAYTYCLVLMAS